jgi:hypothetical protein
LRRYSEWKRERWDGMLEEIEAMRGLIYMEQAAIPKKLSSRLYHALDMRKRWQIESPKASGRLFKLLKFELLD